MNEFKLKDYKSNYVMHCNNVEEYNTFYKYLQKMKRFFNADKYVQDLVWNNKNNNGMVFYFNSIQPKYSNYRMMWNYDYHCSNDYTILEFSDFDWKQEESD